MESAAPNHIMANCGCVMCVSFIRPPCQEVIEKAESQKKGTRLLILYVPYVGIIQIRLWVKAIAYSQPTLVSTPLWLHYMRIIGSRQFFCCIDCIIML